MPHVDDGQLNALLDGELEPADAREVEAHLASCILCGKRLEEAKQFLAESASLLDVLVPPERPADRPEAAVPLAGVSAGLPPATPSASERRVSKTAKEVALDIDGSTQKSPAIRPIFPRDVERVTRVADEPLKPAAPRRRVDWSQLAWAATVVLAMGVTWMLNELKHAGGAPAGAAQVAVSDGASPATASREPAATGPVAVKPPTARGNKPLPPNRAAEAALDAMPLDRPGPAGAAGAIGGRSNSGDLATRERSDLSGAAGAGTGPATPPAARQQAPPAPAAPSAGAPLARYVSPSPSPSAEAAARSPTRALRPAEAGRSEVAITTFRRVSLDQAARRLSGAIRLIDGRPWDHVEVGPGRLVAGADQERDVVRVFYFDDRGRPLTLDQQRIPAPADTSTETRGAAVETLAMAPGDTLVTTTPAGLTRIRWLDRKFFWLSLAGTMDVDELRLLVNRVR
ncbi:MAG: zf-HC2 domain-containing protein [Gemmatimonadota bacterium]